jgi:hypothetical protein
MTWSEVSRVLRGRGHDAATPSLAGCGPPYWQNHVVRAVEAAKALGDARVAVVGHSGAGPLLPLIATAMGARAACCIYVDAMLPTGGASRVERLPAAFAGELHRTARGGLLPPWGESWPGSLWEELLPDESVRAAFRAELGPTPVAVYEEAVPEPATSVSHAYVQFSGAYNEEAADARARGWRVVQLDGGHLHMLVRPHAVADALVGLIGPQ